MATHLQGTAPNLKHILSRYRLNEEQLRKECSKEVRIEIAKKIIEWRLVGICLGIPNPRLTSIDRDCGGEDQKKVAMLDTWQEREGSNATYLNLADALHRRGRRDLVELICRMIVKMLTHGVGENTHQVDEHARGVDRGEAMFRSNLEDIRSRFAILLAEIKRALKANDDIATEDVHAVIVGMYPKCSESVPNTNLDEIFTTVTNLDLWNYMHHSPVEKVVRRFLPDHISLMTEYKECLAGFYTTAKLIHYIQHERIESRRGRNKLPLRTFNYQKLMVKLELDRNITTLSLKYVMDLWEEFAAEFDIPFLTVVIDRILEGSIDIVWLIQPNVAEKIEVAVNDSTMFFNHNFVVFVAIEDHVLYDRSQQRAGDVEKCRKHLKSKTEEGIRQYCNTRGDYVYQGIVILTDLRAIVEQEFTIALVPAPQGLHQPLSYYVASTNHCDDIVVNGYGRYLGPNVGHQSMSPRGVITAVAKIGAAIRIGAVAVTRIGALAATRIGAVAATRSGAVAATRVGAVVAIGIGAGIGAILGITEGPVGVVIGAVIGAAATLCVMTEYSTAVVAGRRVWRPRLPGEMIPVPLTSVLRQLGRLKESDDRLSVVLTIDDDRLS